MSPAAEQRNAPPRVHVRLESGPEAPARARDALAPLRRAVGDDCLQVLELVVSELVTNSVRHAGGEPGDPVEVSVHCTDRTVRVAVTDTGAGFDPGHRGRAGGGPGGWGLYLVAELADRWWVESGGHTRVVAEVPLSPAGAEEEDDERSSFGRAS